MLSKYPSAPRVRAATFRTLSFSTLAILGLSGCGGSSDDSPTGGPDTGNPENQTLSGVVRNYYTGDPVPNAAVTATTAGRGALETVTTDANGRFAFNAPGELERIAVNASANGFGDTSVIAGERLSWNNENLELSLLPADVTDTFNAGQAVALSVDGVDLVELDANSFVDSDGNPYSGNVTAHLTVIDPSGDPSRMPGGYEAIGADGEEGLMESWGAITATFHGEAGDNLQLAEGRSATIRIPIADARSPSLSPWNIPLFYFDQQDTIWREEGSAQKVEQNGEWFYEGTVNHFTSWNADVLYDAITISGRVVDEAGNPIADAIVRSQGQDYIGGSSTRTAADGTFSLQVRPDSELLISATRLTLSNTREITVGNSDTTLSEDLVLFQASVALTLTWGQNPSDLDSHLYGPANADGSEEFHLYFANKTEIYDDATINLDVDDTRSFGPEVTTVSRFPYPGTYRYMVKRYAGSGTISDSPARVELSIDGETQVFSPANAQGSEGDWWHVVNFVVDTDGSVTTQVVQEWNNNVGFLGLPSHQNTQTKQPIKSYAH